VGADIPFIEKGHNAKLRVLPGVLKGFLLGCGRWVTPTIYFFVFGRLEGNERNNSATDRTIGRDCVNLCKIINMDLRDSRL